MAALSQIDAIPAAAPMRLIVQPVPGEPDPQMETVEWGTTGPVFSEALKGAGYRPNTPDLTAAIAVARAKMQAI